MSIRVRFGAFELDAERHVLRKHGLRLRVPAQSLEILAALIAAGGETVTRESIQKLLWPKGTVVGFEQSINTAVRRLREALGDTARNSRFVERVPGQGYRFVGRAEPLPAAEGEPFADGPGVAVLHYRLLERAGRGSTGEVWKARDTRLDRIVALKFLRDDHRGDDEAARREARHAASVSHPNICTVHGLEEQDGRRFLVMEYVEGRPLSQSLIPGTAPAPEGILGLAIQAADALAAAHEAGLVHGDVKPANLMITREGSVKLTDFGVARRHRPTTAEGGTRGRRTGTIEYMSPEQARGEPLDPRSDLFSLGVVLYELATGTLPFSGDTPDALLDSICRATPPRPRAVNEAVPRGLEAVITRALEKDPGARWQSAAAMAGALRALRRPSVRRAAWRRWGPAAVTTSVVIAVGAAGSMAWRAAAASRSAEVRKEYALALAEKARGNDALPLLEHVLRQDPQFAPAWLSLAQVRFNRGQETRAEEAIARAYALRDRASELDRLLIEASYHSVATKDYEKAIAAATLAAQLHPRVAVARRATFLPYCLAGEIDQALAVARRELELAPDDGVSYFNVAVAELTRGRTSEARAALEQARARGVASELFPFALDVAAALEGDARVTDRPVQPFRETRMDARMTALATQTAGYFGRLARASEIAEAAETAEDAREVAAVAHATVATMEAVFGLPLQAQERARRALRIAAGRRVETSAGFALALAGAPDDAEKVLDRLLQRHPQDRLLSESWAPALRGAAALARGRYSEARAAARTWRQDARFGWPGYVSALVALRTGQPAEAEAGFRGILAEKGLLFTSVVFGGQAAAYPAAQVGLARALAAEGRCRESRRAYAEFFAHWRSADADVPLLREARAEHAALSARSCGGRP